MNEPRAGLNSKISPSAGAFSPSQNRAILIAGLSCACVSLVAAFIALRWFSLMRRSFRHQLVLFLVVSDTFKAVWYFVFAVVAVSNGPVRSSSAFCQASGYLLLLAIEASDFAILLIALHAMLYIFMPISKTGEGGLYPYRKYLYPIWLGPPILAASLAFIQGPEAYVTSGTYCFLPKRPIWYRLALSWVPRYIIITTILVMYLSIYIYVHIKFHSFRNLAKDDSNYGTNSNTASRRSTAPDTTQDAAVTVEWEKFQPVDDPPISMSPPKSQFARPMALRMHSDNPLLGLSSPNKKAPKPEEAPAPWDAMNFITSKPLILPPAFPNPVTTTATTDFAATSLSLSPALDRTTGSADSGETYVNTNPTDPLSPPLRTERAHSVPNNTITIHDSRKPSEVPTVNTVLTTGTSYTGLTQTTLSTQPPGHNTHNTQASISTNPSNPSPYTPHNTKTVDPLRQTRHAIRRQLRFLFIYPLIYLLMWSFPFASQVLNYSDHYVMHPPFWLSVLQTCALALQAGVDSVVFSLRERPWRTIDENSRGSISGWGRKLSATIGGGGGAKGSHKGGKGGDGSGAAGGGVRFGDDVEGGEGREEKRSSNWWEAEGRKRKDSVWMGTDLLQRMGSAREKEKGRGMSLDVDGAGEVDEEAREIDRRRSGSGNGSRSRSRSRSGSPSGSSNESPRGSAGGNRSCVISGSPIGRKGAESIDV